MVEGDRVAEDGARGVARPHEALGGLHRGGNVGEGRERHALPGGTFDGDGQNLHATLHGLAELGTARRRLKVGGCEENHDAARLADALLLRVKLGALEGHAVAERLELRAHGLGEMGRRRLI